MSLGIGLLSVAHKVKSYSARPFVSGPSPSAWCFQVIRVGARVAFPSFLWLSNIPPHSFTVFYLSVCPSVNAWVVLATVNDIAMNMYIFNYMSNCKWISMAELLGTLGQAPSLGQVCVI